MGDQRRSFVAGLSVLLSAGVGLITNLLTERFGWGLLAGLSVLVLLGGVAAWWLQRSSPGARTVVHEKAARRSTISGGRIEASGGARVRELATDESRIVNSDIVARGADVERAAGKKSYIEGRNISASE